MESEINDQIDYTSLKEGTFKLREESFRLQTLLMEVLQMFKPASKVKGIKLKLKLSHKVPNLVRCDRSRVQQVLRNYLKNALKFTV